MKVTNQITNGNKIKRKIMNIKYKSKGKGRGMGQVEAMPLVMV